MPRTRRPLAAVVVAALVSTLLSTTYAGLVAPAEARPGTTRVTVKAPRTSTDGQVVVVTGKIKPRSANRDVQLQERIGTGWVLLARSRTTKASTYAVPVELPTGGHTLRVVARAKKARLGSSRRRQVTVVADPANRGDRVAQGGMLTTGQYLRSANRRYQLLLQPDGMLVLRDRTNGAVLWARGAAGATSAGVRPDSDFVVQAPSGPAFSAGTGGLPDGVLVVQDDGNLVLYAHGLPVWNRVQGYVGDRLTPGATVPTGAALQSPGGRYQLLVQGDGNVVEYDRSTGTPVWSTGTSGAGHVLSLGPDGNLAVLRGGAVVWSAGASGFAGAVLLVQDDGNVVVYSGGLPTWSRATGYVGDRVFADGRVAIGTIRRSPNRRYLLLMQPDGNLVEYDGGTAVWSTKTSGDNVAIMQGDGNLVVYRIGGDPLFSSGTSSPGAELRLQDDGNVVIVDTAGMVVWTAPR